MSHRDDITLAEWVSHGWILGLFCGRCRRPVAALTGEEIMARFGDHLLATVSEVCARLKCPCGSVGGWPLAVAGICPEVAVSGASGERVGNWIARDLHLRRLLAEHGRPLEIADRVWAKIEAFGREHPHWEARHPDTPTYPLSEAAMATATVESERTQPPTL